MVLKGKRVAVLAEKMYQELELWYPALRMREAGAEVKIVETGSSPTYASKQWRFFFGARSPRRGPRAS